MPKLPDSVLEEIATAFRDAGATEPIKLTVQYTCEACWGPVGGPDELCKWCEIHRVKRGMSVREWVDFAYHGPSNEAAPHD